MPGSSKGPFQRDAPVSPIPCKETGWWELTFGGLKVWLAFSPLRLLLYLQDLNMGQRMPTLCV